MIEKRKKNWQILLAFTAITSFSFVGSVNAEETDFSYSGDTGPGYWYKLNPEWEACAGTAPDARQSPIDIAEVQVDRRLRPLGLAILPTTIDLFNNGHTIEQNYEDTGSSIFFEGRVYDLLQFHFHTLSEHAIEGELGDMELHAVFWEPSVGDYLVVGQLFEVSEEGNPFIQELIDAGLPPKNGDTTVTNDMINVADVFTNISSYYTYQGSFTTPPCSEIVTWVVLQNPAEITEKQFQAFRRILGNDFRPLQELNDRVVRATRDVRVQPPSYNLGTSN
jgi:carbonic anhydrase